MSILAIFVRNIFVAMTRFKITLVLIYSSCSSPTVLHRLPKTIKISRPAMDFSGGAPKETGKRKANGSQRDAEEEDQPTAGGRMDQKMKALEDQIKALNVSVGTGEHQQNILTALTQSSTTNARDLANLQATSVANYEINNAKSNYLIFPKQCLIKFSEHCKMMKGKPQHTGHPKNYVLIGLAEALIIDKDATPEEKEIARLTVRSKVIDAEGKVDLTKAQEIGAVASFCQVTITPKKGFINIALYPNAQNQILMAALDKAFLREGIRQWDPPPPKPVNKDLRKWMLDQRS
jgi:hypothetical protein